MVIISIGQEAEEDGGVQGQEIKALKHPIRGQNMEAILQERDKLVVLVGQHQWYAYNEYKIIPWIFFG